MEPEALSAAVNDPANPTYRPRVEDGPLPVRRGHGDGDRLRTVARPLAALAAVRQAVASAVGEARSIDLDSFIDYYFEAGRVLDAWPTPGWRIVVPPALGGPLSIELHARTGPLDPALLNSAVASGTFSTPEENESRRVPDPDGRYVLQQDHLLWYAVVTDPAGNTHDAGVLVPWGHLAVLDPPRSQAPREEWSHLPSRQRQKRGRQTLAQRAQLDRQAEAFPEQVRLEAAWFVLRRALPVDQRVPASGFTLGRYVDRHERLAGIPTDATTDGPLHADLDGAPARPTGRSVNRAYRDAAARQVWDLEREPGQLRGTSLATVAETLGVDQETLRRWVDARDAAQAEFVAHTELIVNAAEIAVAGDLVFVPGLGVGRDRADPTNPGRCVPWRPPRSSTSAAGLPTRHRALAVPAGPRPHPESWCAGHDGCSRAAQMSFAPPP